jgi:hypothetical protein
MASNQPEEGREALFIRPLGETSTCEHCGGPRPPEWAVFDNDTTNDAEDAVSSVVATRGEAIQVALDSQRQEAIVLLKADGSVHSEVRPAVIATEPGQAVNGGAVEEE